MKGRFDPAWPSNPDGDVFRRLHTHGFDFEISCAIDFNIDFDAWPPPSEFIALLKQRHSGVQVFEPENQDSGYISFVVNAKLTYELVLSVQSSVSELAAPFGGVCESWGVLH
ncbi:ribonuclease E inhibitor RraB [Nevskia sp.]|uniref:ribonuclease E inhibitor RraB n=1 Tax=Nevskia sp. TaxID=1929292 RepID=UPI0025D8B1EC|nr:ribonuclease E inhibitor RraB [Nevskia sp.]